MLRALINSQIWLSERFDRLLPARFTKDGNRDFAATFVPKYLTRGLKVYEVGGGKRPYITRDIKDTLCLHVTGLDIDGGELAAAPEGVYDRTIVTSIAEHKGSAEADLVICRAVLEHVGDTERAFAAIASILKPSGIALVFVPSKYAAFAIINRLLPEGMRRKVLYTIYPNSRALQGFVSYYHKCSLREFKAMAASNALEVAEERRYYTSGYFQFCFPLHLAWRLWMALFYMIDDEAAAETFSVALKKT